MIDQKEELLLTGEFTPGSNFSAVEELFQQVEKAVDVQALSIIDQLDKGIVALS